MCDSIKSGEIYDRRYFKTINSVKLGELFEEWVGRYADHLVPFGKPKTEIEFTYQKDNHTPKLLFTQLNSNDYINIIIKPIDNPRSLNTQGIPLNSHCISPNITEYNTENTTDNTVDNTTDNMAKVDRDVGSEIIFVNGPTTEILSGGLGAELKAKLITSLNSLINAFELDINKFLTIS
eukprot:XP_763341.1 hypothetical protein [Theileria parva strain Muguga]